MNYLAIVVASALGHILGRLITDKIDRYIERYMNDKE